MCRVRLLALLLPTLAAWVAPKYQPEVAKAMRSVTLTNPPEKLAQNPYDDRSLDTFVPPFELCGVMFPTKDTYELRTFDSLHALDKLHGFETHRGGCGVCSSLQDLAVYLDRPDLTTPVRQCALKSMLSKEWAMECLMELGFTEQCADIWYYNAQNTRRQCLVTCLWHLFAPNNMDDGSLNPCLQCDEDLSGPVFQKVAGRIRRNSGLQSAISRKNEEVARVEHLYLPGVKVRFAPKPSTPEQPSAPHVRDEL